jgi:purine-binding chemotaxis protein CheW
VNELVVIVEIGKRRAALRTSEVQSVVELEAISAVPRAPAFVLGLTALRSNTLTVIDAAAAIGLAPSGVPAPGTRAVIVDEAGHRYALVVDAIDDVAAVLGEPAAVPGDAGSEWDRVSAGLIETDRGPAVLIDLGALLAGPLRTAA